MHQVAAHPLEHENAQQSPSKMAEIPALASIVGVASAGAKLSLLLYDFAASVASAKGDILAVGRDVALFCAVLRQVGSVFGNQKAARFSSSALDTTLEIVERCKAIFEELNTIVQKLVKDRGDGAEAVVGFVAKVKWTFKRSRVRLLQGSLDSMKITLHLMLTTLDFSDKIYSRRNSRIRVFDDDNGELHDEEDQAQSVAESLVIAHQSSIETLQELEEKEEDENGIEEEEEHRNDTSHAERAQNDNGGPKILESWASMASITSNSTLKRKTSIWLSEVVSQPSYSRPGTPSSEISETRQQPLILAGRWTMEGRNQTGAEPVRTRDNMRRPTPSAVTSNLEEYIVRRAVETIRSRQARINSKEKEKAKQHEQPPKGTPSSSSHAFERWEALSTQWEGLTDLWMRRLQKDEQEIRGLPLTMQLSRQVTDLSAFGEKLFQAVVELQRLRASSERKFQRWFVDMRGEQERAQEMQAHIEASQKEERRVLMSETESAREEAARLELKIKELGKQVVMERKKRSDAIRLLTYDSGLEEATTQEEVLPR
ncbi:hypothetical protein B0J14DRAFT_704958 [Halenospora varia]|nr:hypothetical protein B0J14DRAFT_704958 [Halenospora varia]